MQLELTRSLRTGHDAIDADHAHIIDAINAITREARTGGQPSVCHALMEEFIDTCAAHFRKEEEILAQAAYPALAEHSDCHNQMLEKARAAYQLCRTADDQAAHLRHLEDVVSLLIDDIVRSDMAFVSYLQAQGLARARP